MLGGQIRRRRVQRGLSQAQLAARAGVSRQLVGSVEAGRHLPRVDAAAQLARALDTTVEALLAPATEPVASATGNRLAPGATVRVGRVGERLVAAPAAPAGERWEPADAVVGEEGLELLPGADPGTVILGCDPALGLVERLIVERGGPRVLAVAAPTATAVAALADRRAHAGLVHGPAERLPQPPVPVRRQHLARWRVGLAAPVERSGAWWQEALAGRARVAQREPEASSQTALVGAVTRLGGTPPPGPRVAGHLEAAAASAREGIVSVTIEPAATAAGLAFHPLEEHHAQLWIAEEHADDAGLAALGEVLRSAGFRQRIAAIGGYDLTDVGQRITP